MLHGHCGRLRQTCPVQVCRMQLLHVGTKRKKWKNLKKNSSMKLERTVTQNTLVRVAQLLWGIIENKFCNTLLLGTMIYLWGCGVTAHQTVGKILTFSKNSVYVSKTDGNVWVVHLYRDWASNPSPQICYLLPPTFVGWLHNGPCLCQITKKYLRLSNMGKTKMSSIAIFTKIRVMWRACLSMHNLCTTAFERASDLLLV